MGRHITPTKWTPNKASDCTAVYSNMGEPVAHVLSADLVKHNRGGFKGDQGGTKGVPGGTKGDQEGTGGDLDLVQAGLAERQVGTEEFLTASKQKTNNASYHIRMVICQILESLKPHTFSSIVYI